jgi:hypothetical protein
VFTQHALAGAGLLDFGDHRRPALGHHLAQRRFEGPQVAPSLGGFGIGAQAGQAARGAGGRHFLDLDGHDALQDVAHADLVRCPDWRVMALRAAG